MSKTKRMQDVEQRFGKPIDELLRQLYRQEGTTRKVGEALGVSGATVWFWMLRLGIRRRCWAMPEDEQEERHV